MKHLHVIVILLFAVIIPVMMTSPAHAISVAALMSSDQPRYREAHQSLVKALANHNYRAPDTEISLHSPGTAQSSLQSELKKLVAAKPDLIVTYGTPAALAAQRDNSGIPVISVDVFAPEQPLKGMCGVSSRVSMVTLVRTLKSIKTFQRLGVLGSFRDAGAQTQLDDLRKHATKLDITLVEGNVASYASFDSDLGKLLDKCDALVVTEGDIVSHNFDRIIAKAKARRIPVASTMPDAAERGAIVSLEIYPHEQGYLAAEMAVRVLEGARTEFLPLVKPQRTDLVINMRQAREIGIEIPYASQHNATRIIK